MQYRELGRTGWNVSTVSFGCWAIGGTWGPVDDTESLAALHRAAELGVNFFDTSDRYGDGRSERLLARFRRDLGEEIYIATKMGRDLDPHVAEGYDRDNLTTFVERSLTNLETDALDLVQLHCPPTEVYYMPETFGILDDLVAAGKIRHYGVSVEKVEEALKALEYPNLQSVQIIFNLFRHRPADLFFEQARQKSVGIFARVPLASGLLTGKLTSDSTFDADDHRTFNRDGAGFDRGETFSGVDFELGLKAVDELRQVCPPGMSLVDFALRWILMFEAVTCAIPGAKRPEQVEQNVIAADLPALSNETMAAVNSIYDRLIRASVHHHW
ncbi:MAG: aldo/keto reductase [Acidobacteria bacterium]|nr:aldo/keto reductase [Candidatus Sulfomarinibacter kjeldsenii]